MLGSAAINVIIMDCLEGRRAAAARHIVSTLVQKQHVTVVRAQAGGGGGRA